MFRKHRIDSFCTPRPEIGQNSGAHRLVRSFFQPPDRLHRLHQKPRTYQACAAPPSRPPVIRARWAAPRRHDAALPTRPTSPTSITATNTSTTTTTSSPVHAPTTGLCGLPGVLSPPLLRDYWDLAVRPRLDALLRATSREPPGPGFLGLMDRLLAELRSAAAVARHTAGRHVSPAWRQAASEVAAACKKYETFVFQAADDELLSKLGLTAQRLAAQLRALEPAEGPERPEGDTAAVAVPAASAAEGSDRAGQQQQQQRQQAAAVSSLRAQLRLCGLLQRSLLRGGAGLGGEEDDELSWLYAVRTAPSGTQERLSRLLVAEREAAAAVGAAVATGPGPPLALPLGELRRALRWRRRCGGGSAEGAADRGRQAGQDDESGDGDDGSDEDDGGDAALERDPVLGPMLAAAAAAGVPPAVGLPLTPAGLRALLRRHPCAAVRRAAYEAGLLPRLAAALRRLGALAAVRREVAGLQGYSSFSELSYNRAGLAVSDAGAVLGILQALAEALAPAAEAELRQLREAMRDDEEGEEEEEEGRRRAAAASDGRVCDSSTNSSCGGDGGVGFDGPSGLAGGGTPGGGAIMVSELAPWDLDYAQGLMMRRRRLPPEPSELEPYMHLDAVLYGLSEVLYDLMRVRLEVSAPEPSREELEPGEGPPPPELWDPRVVRLTVWSERRLAGVVYLDPGTGYGTRQLRFPAGSTAASTSAPAGEAPAAAAAGADQGASRAEGGDSVSGGGGGGDGGFGGARPESTPAVAVGLQWDWRGGCAANPSALHELLHEMGHALHLILSSGPRQHGDNPAAATAATATAGVRGQTLMHWGGLQLPLDLLEVPSSLMQTLAYDPAVLERICRRRRRSQVTAAAAAAGAAEEDGEEEVMPGALCERLAAYLAAEHCGAVATLHKVFASLVDQLLHSDEGAGGQMGADVGRLWQAVRQAYGITPQSAVTLKELAALPAVAHHQATFHAYLVGLMAASALRRAHPPDLHLRATPHPPQQPPPQPPPAGSSPPAWAEVRALVFEAGGCDDPSELLARMLAPPPAAAATVAGAAAVTQGRGLLRGGATLEDIAPVVATLAELVWGLVGEGAVEEQEVEAVRR
ncbi:FRAS1- extracellular matrix protein 2 [Pleodorina starrii]|uniref:FRAS1- extracellular matrix protein 2 n=1 Tax=Pleodorina starrii TaxID=330485 RepID=A0A9W6F4F8_9CHLO|nr:FRAS1- extracellular matrix protein 2 [Pleodorina starrii]